MAATGAARNIRVTGLTSLQALLGAGRIIVWIEEVLATRTTIYADVIGTDVIIVAVQARKAEWLLASASTAD